ncbi:sensor histidine kinase [Tenuifilum thalassicum]|uniref:histidine kinase n=1 Tax=Tenuifilum thalassicum TaxID=2590900 RepID=A0A7D3XEZ8_9BACT|nr:HAMP domain-containing sensor histidine kinase [Tenuifilum thalassicum]QKG80692.1 HAMP domain-containing histidine kinase [Tenuifilum thalassicum]
MNKKLLDRTQRIYFYISILLFVIAAPLFSFLVNRLYLSEIDESLLLTKADFLNNSVSEIKVNDIPSWNRFNNNIEIQNSIGLKSDTLFNASYFNPIENEDQPYRVLKAPVCIEGKPYTLLVKTNLLESQDLIFTIALLFAMILVLLFSGIYFINKIISTRLWKPFYQTLQQIETFEIDKHSKPDFINSDIEEFDRLNKSIEKLIERNLIIYNNQREFVENAAHELQTPIAIFKAKIDTLIQRTDVTQGQWEILNSVSDTISRLNRLNKNLLLLSKIDKHYFSEPETFSMKELIEKQLDFFIEQAKQKSIEIKTDFKTDFNISSNKGLTEIMLNNLLLNSISHNVQYGAIIIRLAKKELIITNTGKAEELPPEKLFNRFSKSNESVQGNGLGLAIVKKIADLNNWSIAYSFSDNKHTFSVQFK